MGEEQTAAERADRRPAALLPAPVARLGGFAALALLGALQWHRMVAGLPVGRALLWVLAAVAAGFGVLWAQTRARRPLLALPAVTLAALLGAYAASGLDLGLLKPRQWDELGDGIARGVEALGNVRLPYVGADPWPGLTLQLLGALLCVLAALVAFWPREREPGYPFLSLAALLVLVAAPMVSLGGTRQVALGIVLAALTVAFLWLERLPLRPGLGVAALLALAVAGALPFASVADREEPWFDYKSFAEGLGPDDPLRFNWNHAYGPIDWPRDGNEVLRVATAKPSYWKVRNLEEFDGEVWRDGGPGFGGTDPELELPPDWRSRPAWTDELRISVRRMRTADVVGAGTIIGVASPGRRVRPANEPGMWSADTEFRRGDSYTVEAHIPRPTGAQLIQGATGAFDHHAEALVLTVPFRRTARPPRGLPRAPRGTPVRAAQVRFPAFRPRGAGDRSAPRAEYPTLNRSGSGSFALRHSSYARTWRLARRLRRQAETPFAYVLAVDRLLKRRFAYDEAPSPPARGRAPLDAFLFDSKAGYCQHFSGAMALLLRMGGIPSRVVTGFSPGGYSKRKQAWIVRDTDAHSWVEVWFDDWGWVTFDPTPDTTPARSQIAALETAPAPVDRGDDEGAGGGDGAADESRDVREDLLRDPARDAGGDTAGAGGGPAWWWYALAAVAALALAGWLFVRLSRRGRPEVDRAVAELEAALRRSGRPAPVGTTLQQLEQRFGGSPEATAYLRALRAGRYGVAAPEPTAAQRRALRRELASGLGASGWLRALWALPPWRA